MSPIVSQCYTISPMASQCLPMPTNAFQCLPMTPSVPSVFNGLPMSPNVSRCHPMSPSGGRGSRVLPISLPSPVCSDAAITAPTLVSCQLIAGQNSSAGRAYVPHLEPLYLPNLSPPCSWLPALAPPSATGSLEPLVAMLGVLCLFLH